MQGLRQAKPIETKSFFKPSQDLKKNLNYMNNPKTNPKNVFRMLLDQ